MARNKNITRLVGKELFFVTTLFVAAVLVLAMIEPQKAASQGAAGPITGYAWSDTTGWISLNGSGYGLTIAADGTVSGYAWSDNLGWISAQPADVAGCPSSPCTPKVQGGAFSGWLKALAGGTAQSGGWDGWISLSGSGYGVTKVGAVLDGYAWGSTVVGWLDFDAQTEFQECALTQGYYCDGSTSMHRDAQCVVTTNQVCSYLCAQDTGACVPAPAPAGLISAKPQMIVPGDTVVVEWDIDNATSCTVTGTNGDSWTGVSGAPTSSPINDATTFSLDCVGLEETTLHAEASVSLNPQWREL